MSSHVQCPDCKRYFKCLLQHLRRSPGCNLYKRLAQKAQNVGIHDEFHDALQKFRTTKNTETNDQPREIECHANDIETMSDIEEGNDTMTSTVGDKQHLLKTTGLEEADIETLVTDQNNISHAVMAHTLEEGQQFQLCATTPNSPELALEVENNNQTDPLEIPMNARYNFVFTPAERSLFRIYDLLEYVGTPRYVMDCITKAIQEEIVQNNFNPVRDRQTRQTFVNKMMKEFPTPTPVVEKVGLEGIRTSSIEQVDVIHFDFEQQLRDLLGDHEMFNNMDNLVVNDGVTPDRWKPYEPNPKDKLDEVMDGLWYKETCTRILTGNHDEFIMPIILYLDKTGTDIQQRHGLEPVVFTTAILNRQMRNKTRAWRILGYIPDLDLSSKAAKAASRQKKEGKGRSTRNYHHCLEVILRSFKQAQDSKPLVWLRLGTQVKQVCLHLPLAFVIGDGKSNDHLCCRYGGHKAKRACRACTVPFAMLDQPGYQCEWLSSHTVDNAVCKLFDDNTPLAAKR